MDPWGSNQYKKHRPCCVQGTRKVACLEQSEQRQESRSQGGVWVGEYRNEQMNTKNMGWEKEETFSRSVLLAF